MGETSTRQLRGAYRLGNPALHGMYSFETPIEKPVEEIEGESEESFAAMAEAPAVPGREIQAVWIVHGMGQQMPFETLDQLANGLMDACERDGHSRPEALVREAKIGGQIIQRVELSLPSGTARDGKPETVEVHLYEAYWAPLTEGVANLRNVMSFLWNGATRGLVNWARHFQRAMFGEMVPFKLTWRTPLYTATALLVLVALTIIDLVVLASGAGKVFGGSSAFAIPATAFGPITTVASIVSVVAITFGVVLFLAGQAGGSPSAPEQSEIRQAQRKPGFWAASLRDLSWIAFAGTVATIIGGSGCIAWVLSKCFYATTPKPFVTGLNTPGIQPFLNFCVLVGILLAIVAKIAQSWRRNNSSDKREREYLLGGLFYAAILLFIISCAGSVWLLFCPSNVLTGLFTAKWLSSAIWIWPFLALISSVVRNLLIEYVGDVAIYVMPNKLDAFSEVRAKIKDVAYQSASAVFLAQAAESESMQYSKVAILGHSLGSVIAYDTLNRLINEDLLTGQKASIINRTGLLLTFGSPLDKIAFFFTAIGKNVRHIREQLASVVQPLIQNYAYRPFPWINVFSRNDIVCGSLDFYDFPSPTELDPGGLCANDQACIQRVREIQNEAGQNHVENIRDEEALTPLVAHVQYWTDRILWDRLYENLIS
jgi:hypothetical protein